MPDLQRVIKPATRKGKKILLDREPKLVENCKHTLFVQGRRTGDTVKRCMKDLFDLKKPQAKMLSRKNDILPFEDITPVEGFSRKHQSSLFVFGSHNKKRPNNLVLGRTYDGQMLDMIELGIAVYKGLHEFKLEKIALGMKPCLLFAGDLFEHNYEYQRLKNLLVDLFHRETVKSVRLQGLEHVLMFTAVEDTIYVRSYKTSLKKSGTKLPRVELVEIGPAIDLKMRRTKLASHDLFKLSCKKPKELKVKTKKNISKDAFGTKHGRIHITKQNITLQTRKMKGLKKTKAEKKTEKAALGKRKAGQDNEDSSKRTKTTADDGVTE